MVVRSGEQQKKSNPGRSGRTQIQAKSHAPGTKGSRQRQSHMVAGTAGRNSTATSRASSKDHSSQNRRSKQKANNGPRSAQHRAVNKTPSLQVGQYLVGKTIGQGTFGKVKLGVHSKTGEKVAIKILEKRKIVEVADVERVSREILVLKRVGAVHDNVIRLFEVIDTPKAIYLIMEYCSGEVAFRPLSKWQNTRRQHATFHQILNGVEYLHKCNIVHRDLKPENLLMQRRPEGWNIAVDFGLSNTDDGGKLLKTACGSPCYAAPEMIAGKICWPQG